jgi:hypothetical protein
MCGAASARIRAFRKREATPLWVLIGFDWLGAAISDGVRTVLSVVRRVVGAAVFMASSGWECFAASNFACGG